MKCKEKNEPLAGCLESLIIEHEGTKIGLIGLAEKEWLVSMSTFGIEDVNYERFTECA